MLTRKYVPLSPEAQAERRPPPVGVLLSGIDSPVQPTNVEKLIGVKRLSRPTPEKE